MDAVMRIGHRLVENLRAAHVADAEQRVARGAKLLDKKRPGWWRKVRFKDFDMAEPCHCVLGQVFKDKADDDTDGYNAALPLLRLSATGGTTHGFEAESEGPAYDELQFAWWQEISRRRRRMAQRRRRK